MQKIKREDEVIVIAGKDKGKRGKVIKFTKNSQRVLVAGVNMVKKHTKPNPQMEQAGGIIEQEAAMAVSNIALYNNAEGKADKVNFKEVDGKMVRVFRSTGENVDL